MSHLQILTLSTLIRHSHTRQRSLPNSYRLLPWLREGLRQADVYLPCDCLLLDVEGGFDVLAVVVEGVALVDGFGGLVLGEVVVFLHLGQHLLMFKDYLLLRLILYLLEVLLPVEFRHILRKETSQ